MSNDMRSGRLLLIVDRDLDFVESLRILFDGERVVAALSLDEAVEMVEWGRIDYAVLGPSFGHEAGVRSAAELLRADPSLTAVLVANVVTNRVLRAALQVGLADVIETPVTLRKFDEILGRGPRRVGIPGARREMPEAETIAAPPAAVEPRPRMVGPAAAEPPAFAERAARVVGPAAVPPGGLAPDRFDAEQAVAPLRRAVVVGPGAVATPARPAAVEPASAEDTPGPPAGEWITDPAPGPVGGEWFEDPLGWPVDETPAASGSRNGDPEPEAADETVDEGWELFAPPPFETPPAPPGVPSVDGPVPDLPAWAIPVPPIPDPLAAGLDLDSGIDPVILPEADGDGDPTPPTVEWTVEPIGPLEHPPFAPPEEAGSAPEDGLSDPRFSPLRTPPWPPELPPLSEGIPPMPTEPPPLPDGARSQSESAGVVDTLFGPERGRRERPEGGGRVIAVMAGKGGSGKTVTAVNLAVGLTEGPGSESVVLVDADLQFGDVALLLQLAPTVTVADVAAAADDLSPERLDSVLLRHESGLRVLPAPLVPRRAGTVGAKQMVKVIERLQQVYGFVVVDTSAVFDDTLADVLDVADDVLVVVDMDISSVKNAKIALDTLRSGDFAMERVRLVVNRVNSKARLDLAEMEQSLGLRVSASLPSDRLIPQSVNEGIPAIAFSPRSKVAKAFRALAESFLPEER